MNIKLETITREDADSYYNLLDTNRKFLSKWIDAIDEKASEETRQEFDNFLSEFMPKIENGEVYIEKVMLDGDFVGIVDARFEDDTAEIGYWLAQEATGKRVGGKAVKLLVEKIFSSCPEKHRLIANTYENNIPSNKLLKARGFSVVANQGGVNTYSLSREDEEQKYQT